MKKFIPVIFFASSLLLGFFLFDDYGVSWDEPIQRELGIANWNYVLNGDDSLFHLYNKYHGPIVELMEAAPEKFFSLQNEKTIFLSRHLINYFIFWLGSIFLFLLGKEMACASRDLRIANAKLKTQDSILNTQNLQLLA